MPVTSRNGRHGSQGENDARNSHIPEGQNITDHKVQSLEHKALSLPLPHSEDENIFGIRGKAWSQTQAPAPDPVTTNPAVINPATTKHQHTCPKYQPHDPRHVTREEEPCSQKEGIR